MNYNRFVKIYRYTKDGKVYYKIDHSFLFGLIKYQTTYVKVNIGWAIYPSLRTPSAGLTLQLFRLESLFSHIDNENEPLKFD